MRWILCGKNEAAAASLEFLAERGDEVWAVATASDDGRDGWQRSFRAAAERLGVPLDAPRRVNEPGFAARLAGWKADALLSIQYDQILRGPLLSGIGCPCLNLHFALLPRHRGVAPIAWAILSGDSEAGVTLHHMVEGIDAGDVIAQRRVPVPPDGTARELYDAVSIACVDLFRESYPFRGELLATRVGQDGASACYHRSGDLDFAEHRVDWRRPAGELQRWLRAMIFPPLQLPETTLDGRRLCIERVAGEVGGPAVAPPGTVIERTGEQLEVAAADRSLRITAIRDPGRAFGTAEILRSIEVGDRFETGGGA